MVEVGNITPNMTLANRTPVQFLKIEEGGYWIVDFSRIIIFLSVASFYCNFIAIIRNVHFFVKKSDVIKSQHWY